MVPALYHAGYGREAGRKERRALPERLQIEGISGLDIGFSDRRKQLEAKVVVS